MHGRDREVRATQEFLDSLIAGAGPTLLLEGQAGLGKSALLDSLRDTAAQCGVEVWYARGGELEQGFACGVVRQLLARCTSPLALLENDRLLENGLLDNGRTALPANLYSAAHEIYRLCQGIARRQPLLAVVDDAHWADRESLTVLAFLAARIETDRIGLALSTSPLERVDRDELLGIASAARSVRLLELESLSEDSAGAMVLERYHSAEPLFVRACRDICGGNPLYLKELLSEAIAAGLEPVAASVPALREMTPRRVAIHTMRRLNRLGRHAGRMAQAVALLAPHADPRRCADVVQLDDTECTTAARVLIDAGILRPQLPYGFLHPIVQRAALLSMSLRERQEMHRRVAQSLRDAGEPVVMVARQLLGTLPGADCWTVDILREAAAECLRRNDPGHAADLLRRALAEPPSAANEARVLAELGAAELRAGDATAVTRLTHAWRRVGSRPDRHLIRLDLSQALIAAGNPAAAVELLREGVNETGESHRELTAALRSLLTTVTALSAMDTPRHALRPEAPGIRSTLSATDTSRHSPPPEAPGIRTLSAMDTSRHSPPGMRALAALRGLRRGLPADRVARLAAAALAERDLPGLPDLILPPVCAGAWALAESGRHAEAYKVLSDLVDSARGNGRLLTADAAAGTRAMILLEAGRLDDAAREASSILDRSGPGHAAPAAWLALAAQTHALLELDRPQDAQALLDRMGPIPDAAYSLAAQAARGRATIAISLTASDATAHLADGVRQLLAVRRTGLENGWHHPAIVTGYLLPLCTGLARANRIDLASQIVADELARARAFGAIRPLATALRAQASMIGGGPRLLALQEAGDLLKGSPYLLDLAYAMSELGATLRQAGRRAESRQRLHLARELAQQCAAVGLQRQLRTELRLSGARTPTASRHTIIRLTPAELRVALRAAEGMTNKEIAHALFITVKTVEWHLGQAFRKLGVTRRGELARSLSPPDSRDHAGRPAGEIPGLSPSHRNGAAAPPRVATGIAESLQHRRFTT